MFSAKKSLTEVWPVNKKRFLVLVDPETVTSEDGAASCIPTIAYLVAKGARVIVTCSFGSIKGMPLNLPDVSRETIIKAFQREEGLGLTALFASLSQQDQASILEELPSTPSSPTSRVTERLTLFSSFGTDEKLKAIAARFPSLSFTKSTTIPVAKRLEGLLPGVSVQHAEDPLRAAQEVTQMPPSSVLVLENLRLYRNDVSSIGEERKSMAEIVASYCDVFVNDSFATAADVKSITVEVPKLLKHGAAGMLLTKELSYFRRLLTHPAKPVGVIVGGTHLEAKLPLIYSLVGKVDKILVAGEVALPFLAARGLSAGKGYDPAQTIQVDDESVLIHHFANKILRQAAATGVAIILPVDHVAHVRPTDDPAIRRRDSKLSHHSVDWNVRNDNRWVRSGNESFARILANSGIFSVVAGNNTTRCVRRIGAGNGMSHLSSGGLACLELLKVNLLPAVEALSDASSTLDQASISTVAELLKHLPMFSGCSSHQLHLLAKKTTKRVYAAGDFLVYDGDRYTSMFVVACGSLVACPKALYGCSNAARRVTKGHVVGLYEFVSRHPSNETVQVAENDTVIYQLSCAGLKEAVNEASDLSSQLVANLSKPLRVIAEAEHRSNCKIDAILLRDLTQCRCPQPSKVDGKWGTILVEAAVEVLLHTLALRYRPFHSQAGTCIAAQPMRGIGVRVVFSVVRNLIYHHVVATSSPYIAAISSAVLTTPLRMLAGGTPLHTITFDALAANASMSVVLSLAPIATHALLLESRSQLELTRRRSLRSSQAVAVAALCKIIVGLLAFPVVAARNHCQRNAATFTLYAMKQVLGLLLTLLLRRGLKLCA
ncbi:phosphoglycerate kinase, putative [Bodo saltans]|uniref:Phosphoglycerate kinase n=1 Tax=Bodo saltans TaxID=75058 RepID=A0A0S4IVK9_BODSA|nr:phosphoglycerate kinase, putative [Bodo saltans]|eukprot:CUG04074.1 phosphoglycerate kinase, putative [Bodo saltans]